MAVSTAKNLGGAAQEQSRWEPYLQILVGHLVLFNSFGLVQSFSIFQQHYALLFHHSPSTIAWIGSVHVFLIYLVGTFSGKALDAGYYKQCLGAGIMLQLVGIIGSISCESYELLIIFYSILQGIGHGMMLCPTITNTAVYFSKRAIHCEVKFQGSAPRINQATAMSIASCGAATGGIVFALIAKYSMDSFGIAWTLRIIGLVVLFNSLLVFTLAEESKRNKTTTIVSGASRVIDWGAFKEPSYTLYVLAMFLAFVGLWEPYFYLRDFTTAVIHTHPSTSFLILITLNISGIPGRLFPALISDHILGALNTYILLLLLTSTTLLLWPFVTTKAAMFLWAAAYGFCGGGVGSMLQAGIASIDAGDGNIGVRIGTAFSIVAFASLIGGPVGGMLLEIGDRVGTGGGHGFLLLQIFTGAIMLLGCLVLVTVRLARTGLRVWVKV